MVPRGAVGSNESPQEGQAVSAAQSDCRERDDVLAGGSFHGLLVHFLGRDEQQGPATAAHELFGDGHSYDPDGGAYMATGYEIIFGGWYNQKSIIARMDEHGHDMASRTDVKVVPNQHYHWKIERRGGKVSWWIASPAASITAPSFLVYDDPHPLENTGHEYLGFNNWETDTWFDNLVVTPL